MKILLCGTEESAFAKNLISRLNKERHEIFMITGNKNVQEPKGKGVFQKYAFAYTDTGIANVIGNVSPDVVIFLGNMDENYSRSWQKKEVISYISGVTNLLLCAQEAKVKRFLYLSTLEIYDGCNGIKITGETVPVPLTSRVEAILQGEEVCKFYGTKEFDVRILRMGTVYGGFEKRVISDEVIEPLAQQIRKQATISCRKNKVHFLTYISDAVEAVCRTVTKSHVEEIVIPVPGENITEEKVIQSLGDIFGRNVKLEYVEEDFVEKHYCFEEEDIYNIRLKYKFKDGLMQYTRIRNSLSEKEKKLEKKQKDTKQIHRKIIEKIRPVLETIVVFLLAFLIETAGGDLWLLKTVDFYLLYVVLIAAIHGTNCALIALILSVFGKFSFEIYANGLGTIVVDYGKYLWVLQLLIAGVLAGFMRDKYWRKTQDLTEELDYYKLELENLGKINESNVYVKGVYEKRLTNYKNSLARIYEITSQLDFVDSRKVNFKAVDVIREIMECPEVSIYTRSGQGPYFRLMASSTNKYRNIGKSFRYDEAFPVYNMLEEDGIYRNRRLEKTLPLMASRIKDAAGTQTIIMIWSLDINNINQYQINLLRVLSKLIEKAMVRANQFMENMFREAYYPETKVVNASGLQELIGTYQEGKEKGLLEYAMLEIVRIPEMEDWLGYLEQVRKMMRDTDIVGMDAKGKGLIVLPASNEEDARIVINRLSEKNVQVTALS